jgi:chromosomal replication initiator protein
MDSFWTLCLSRFAEELPSQQFETWIKPLEFQRADGAVRLLAPNQFVLQWVRDRFLVRIERMAADHFATPVPVVLALQPKSAHKPAPPVPQASATAPATAAPEAPRSRSDPDARNRLNPTFTFATFVPGKANQLARAAALQVSENPGTAYNPLFIYGGTGLGKTHLIQAIGNHILQGNQQARVRYVHAERYVSDVVRAYQHKSFDSFKNYYHSLDLLMIDDIQFFGGKARTQEEFFFAFNALIEAHKQVIITCDSFPKEIAGMEDRLISRFGWGLTVAIEPPELEMRVAILIRKAAAEKVKLDEDVAFYIAKHIQSNVRDLEGALKRVLAYATFNGVSLTLDSAKDSLKDLVAVQSRQVSLENIQKTVADYYKIKVSEMYSKKRTRAVARPRQVAMALAKELTQFSLPDIGEAFGGRDHTTVLHACRKITELRESDSVLHRDFVTLQQILRN